MRSQPKAPRDKLTRRRSLMSVFSFDFPRRFLLDAINGVTGSFRKALRAFSSLKEIVPKRTPASAGIYLLMRFGMKPRNLDCSMSPARQCASKLQAGDGRRGEPGDRVSRRLPFGDLKSPSAALWMCWRFTHQRLSQVMRIPASNGRFFAPTEA